MIIQISIVRLFQLSGKSDKVLPKLIGETPKTILNPESYEIKKTALCVL